MFKNKKIFILGMARSGFEAAKILAKDNEVLVTDMSEQDKEQVKELEKLGVKVIITEDALSLLDDSYDVMIKNPGIKYSTPAVVKAKELGMEVINEVELGYRYLDKKVNIIGVTGSNGKTTTVTLIYLMMKEAGLSVLLGGNIGTPFCRFVKDIKDGDYLVMEISDHQLCDMYKFKTNVSVLTNIYDAHADFHDSHERYVETKKKIFNNHTKNDIAIINRDNQEAVDNTKDINSTKYYFSKDKKEHVYMKDNAIYYEDEKIVETKDIKLVGNHNYENIMAAISAVKVYDVDNESICKVLSTFGGVEHRIEFVTTIDGVDYYNDSKATNCESTKTALAAFSRPILLILGGLDRGHSFDDLTPKMGNVTYVACYGETKERIKEYCDRIGVDCGIFDNLHNATIACYEKAQSGDVVLLSPACASWDQYKAFEDRGNEFKDLVKSFK